MSKYLVLLIAITLVTVMFAGCISSHPAPQYNIGDVVSDSSSKSVGLLVVQYGRSTDLYSLRGVVKSNDGSWSWLQQSQSDNLVNRAALEEEVPYKIGYISDRNSIKSGPAVALYPTPLIYNQL